MFKSHFKITLRTLARAKTYTALNVFGLAIGLACVTLIAAWSLDELSFDRFHSKYERIFRIAGTVKTDSETFDQAITSAPLAEALEREFPEIEHVVRLDMNDCIVRTGNRQFEENGVLFADQSFFEIFDYPLLQGDIRTALREPNSLVLTTSIAQKYFGDENPVGKIMTLHLFDPDGNGAPYKITGITPDPPRNAHFTFRILGSFSTYQAVAPEAAGNWLNNRFYTYLLLRAGTDPKALEQKLPDFAERYMGDAMREYKMFYTFALQPLASLHLHSSLRYEISPTGKLGTVLIFATIGLFILLIACINYMNLATARSLKRAKEVGVKKALGAEKSHLLGQFLVESMTIAASAFVLALFFIDLLQPAFLELTGKHFEQIFSIKLLLLMSGITVAIGLFSGLYPAFFISAFGTASILKASFKSSKSGIIVRKGLVILQFAIAITLLAGLVVVKSQMEFIRSKDLGFGKDSLLTLKVNGFAEVQNGMAPFKAELLSNTDIEGVSISRGLIVGGLGDTYIETIDGSGKSISTNTYLHRVDADFLKVYEIELLAGRNFSEADSQSAYLVNETAVRAFGWQEPQQALDKPIVTGGDMEGRVVGVVKDFHFSPLQKPISPVVIRQTSPTAFSRISIRLKTASLVEMMLFIEQKWRKHFPNALFQHTFIDDRLQQQYRQERLFGNIFSAFVTVAIVVACLGLFGLISFAAEQRTKEIGIRKVLGASVAGVAALLSKDFVKLVLLANVIAWPVAGIAMNKWLENFAYRVEISWSVFALAGGMALLIALLTVSTQAIRAALANPVESLRYE